VRRLGRVRSRRTCLREADQVRLRTTRTLGCQPRQTALAVVPKLAESAERHWCRLDGWERFTQAVASVHFRDGELVRAAKEQVAASSRTPNVCITLPWGRKYRAEHDAIEL
jgi:hypothetical protein